ncbi:MAG: hydrogenase subunit MbhD domain-containing protein [Myxococcota bacterium]
MTTWDWTMDGALALALPVLAWRALVGDSLHEAVILFVALGFLMAVAWARLAAPDVALVEAAVGAGLTGALLMGALGGVGTKPSRRTLSRGRQARQALLLALLLGLGVALCDVMFGLSGREPGLGVQVLARLDESGASHPVTAILLNFRGYDTLLEIAVLLVAAVGSASGPRRAAWKPGEDSAHPLVLTLVGLLIPGNLLVAGSLLWAGSHAPGGAFQAGAVLGGAGVLLVLAGVIRAPDASSLGMRAGLLVGPAVFLAAATVPLLEGRHLLEYPPRWAGGVIFAIEAALTVSIALILTLFFAGVVRLGPVGEEPPGRERP